MSDDTTYKNGFNYTLMRKVFEVMVDMLHDAGIKPSYAPWYKTICGPIAKAFTNRLILKLEPYGEREILQLLRGRNVE